MNGRVDSMLTGSFLTCSRSKARVTYVHFW